MRVIFSLDFQLKCVQKEGCRLTCGCVLYLGNYGKSRWCDWQCNFSETFPCFLFTCTLGGVHDRGHLGYCGHGRPVQQEATCRVAEVGEELDVHLVPAGVQGTRGVDAAVRTNPHRRHVVQLQHVTTV